jgi:NADH-quinone oxidoreductase subunit L
MAHGFFKGLLFLDSGSVIHAVHDEQDMRKMGGLSKKIPITYWTMLIGSIAISGIPPLAGFFSKDEILGDAFKNGFYWVWAIGLIVAGMTAFYMFRLIGLTFWGKSRVDPEVEPHIHESPRSMTIPLILLAIPTLFIGLAIGWPPENGLLHTWLSPIFAGSIALAGRTENAYSLFGIDGALVIGSVAVAAFGIALAWRFFGVEFLGLRRSGRPEAVHAAAGRFAFLYRASLNKWWFDELYDLLFIRIGGVVANSLWWFDRTIIDGTVNGIGALTADAGRELRRVQTGRVQNYALGIAIGLIVMAGGYLVIATH